jgi:hypothetical protein
MNKPIRKAGIFFLIVYTEEIVERFAIPQKMFKSDRKTTFINSNFCRPFLSNLLPPSFFTSQTLHGPDIKIFVKGL